MSGVSLTSAVDIDVVVLTWNDHGTEQRAADSAHASVGVKSRCVIVDNGSDPAAALDLHYGDNLIRLTRNRGVAAGRNIGARNGTAPYVCFLDSDAELYPETLRTLMAVLEVDDSVALAAPVFDEQLPSDSGGLAPTLGRKVQRLTGRTGTYAGGAPREGLINVDFAIGACQLFRRIAFEEIGGLDERYFYGPEDVDFCMRLRRAGWRVVQVPEAHCSHPPRRRHRQVLSMGGFRHATAVLRFLWRQRSYRHEVPVP